MHTSMAAQFLDFNPGREQCVKYCLIKNLIIRRDQNKIEIPGQDPCEIGAGGRNLFFYFFPMYVHVHAMLNFFTAFSGYFIQFFYRQQVRGLPVQFFYISANDGSDLYIRESYKPGFV